MQKVITLVLGDFKNIRRDPMLLLSILAPLLLTVVIRFLVPPLQKWIWNEFLFDLSRYYVFMMSFAMILCPLMIGMLTGFLLLDERDENLLMYFSVTPLRKSGFLWFRLTSPFLLSCLFSLILFAFARIVEFHLIKMLPIIFLISLSAPLITLFLGVFASNKVEGLALSKIAGLVIIAPGIAFFVPSQVQFIAGILPPFWVAKAFLSLYPYEPLFWLYVFVGFLVNVFFLLLLFRKFNDKSY